MDVSFYILEFIIAKMNFNLNTLSKPKFKNLQIL